ncbi:hypothetical protein Z517_06684 [Fonsecaea pedrosoi CBS 271.37]|uniref:Unplaced genomic scaffold supercont1.4, whole genome shotgun sequence n=1 Tax=Fonsecaea pedrosoi CBS 271.37 TaxID=1442368 RepID=A0A0D2H632_9EURO|nr:uncharacterized protein Z517_06684 [Fonsecaea pedrosoi CBS 271.37]KIW80069.1 hypothetical protein Z517_06684 [Fonsecaea pedrosoi CBS 271.37]
MDSDAENEVPVPDPVFPSSPARPTVAGAPDINTSQSRGPVAPRTVPYVTLDDKFAQGEEGKTYFSRPNRYFGPVSTWNSWTKAERTVALSLDRVRSQDLSIHLFDAFGLKRKLRQEGGGGRESKRSKKGKERASSVLSTTSRDDEDESNQARHTGGRNGLARSWTAWPIPPDQVPREELLPRMEGDGGYRMAVDSRPSANLEEWLIATATRIARERWNERRWEAPSTTGASQRDMKVDHGEAEVDVPEDQEAVEEAESPDSPEATEEPVFYSQPFSFYDDDDAAEQASVPAEGESDSDTSETERRPVPLADDEKAREYFLPSARHILSQVDDLLLGLHKARYAYAFKPPSKRRAKYSHSPEDDTSDFARGRSGSRPAARQRARSASVFTDISSASVPSAASGARSRRVENLGLRDWSDVMGMATLTRWDPAVVERASRRCAKLFDGNMLYRTFYEGEGKDGSASHFTEHLAYESESQAPSRTGEQEAESTEDEGLLIRTSRPCERCQATKGECQPANGEHGGARTCRNCQEMGNACSGIQVQVVKNDHICPHQSCPRHKVPFRKRWYLHRHLESVHRQRRGSWAIKKTPASRSTSISANSANLEFDTDRESDNDPEHQIVCPVPSCPRARVPFSKGKKLYEHIRRMHPDMDVDKVKKSEASRRGEKRGRWRDERRTRSKSKSRSKSRFGDVSRSQSRTRSRRAGATREEYGESENESKWRSIDEDR